MRFRLFKMDLTQIILTLFLSLLFYARGVLSSCRRLSLSGYFFIHPFYDESHAGQLSQLCDFGDKLVPVVGYLFNSVFSAAATVNCSSCRTMVAFALSKHNFSAKTRFSI